MQLNRQPVHRRDVHACDGERVGTYPQTALGAAEVAGAPVVVGVVVVVVVEVVCFAFVATGEFVQEETPQPMANTVRLQTTSRE
jgi:hypothetical protein